MLTSANVIVTLALATEAAAKYLIAPHLKCVPGKIFVSRANYLTLDPTALSGQESGNLAPKHEWGAVGNFALEFSIPFFYRGRL